MGGSEQMQEMLKPSKTIKLTWNDHKVFVAQFIDKFVELDFYPKYDVIFRVVLLVNSIHV